MHSIHTVFVSGKVERVSRCPPGFQVHIEPVIYLRDTLPVKGFTEILPVIDAQVPRVVSGLASP